MDHAYVEYVPGDCDVIVLAAHGGREISTKFAVRSADDSGTTRGAINLKSDLYTIEMAELIVHEYQTLTGRRPYLILNHLHRKYMDANRRRESGSGNDDDAGLVWDAFQSRIETAKNDVGERGGVIVDVHGHTHKEGFVELGYTIVTEVLNSANYDIKDSTLRNLISKTGCNLITGRQSLGTLLDEAGYPSIPSHRTPSPGQVPYYRGGYIVQTHGSRNGGRFDAIQVEIPESIRNKVKAGTFCETFAKALEQILQLPRLETFTEY